MEKDRETFQKYAMSKESYLTALWDNSQKITAYREKQLLDAGRDDLLPLMEELEANLYQYNEVDAELLSSQHDFQDGTITQQQYNSVVQAYEQLLKELDEEIDQLKAKLAEEGYNVGKINVDDEGELAERYHVMNIPTLIIFKNGEEKERMVGVQSKDLLESK